MNVFVYGTLKRGHGNHQRFLCDSEFIGTAVTAPLWQLKSAGGFPVLQRGNQVVQGEVFKIDRVTLRDLDMLESEGHMYHRHRIYVKLQDGSTVRCWTYVGNQRFWNHPMPPVPNNDWSLTTTLVHVLPSSTSHRSR